MLDYAHQATSFLKALANENRLLILYHLIEGEKTVTQLESLLGIRQPTLSQQLARLRSEHLVVTRRSAKSIYYSLAGEDATLTIRFLEDMFGDGAGDALARISRREFAAAD